VAKEQRLPRLQTTERCTYVRRGGGMERSPLDKKRTNVSREIAVKGEEAVIPGSWREREGAGVEGLRKGDVWLRAERGAFPGAERLMGGKA